jgi:uncharacterized protein (TIGR02246 family)
MTRLITALWLALAAAGAFAQDTADTLRHEVMLATAAWIEAFNTRDPQRIAARYAPDAVFWGTVSPTIRTTPREILEYFEASAARRPTLRMSLGEQHVRVYGELAINSGYYTSRYMDDGREIATPMRFTFAFRKSADGWVIVNHHSSRMPAP